MVGAKIGGGRKHWLRAAKLQEEAEQPVVDAAEEVRC